MHNRYKERPYTFEMEEVTTNPKVNDNANTKKPWMLSGVHPSHHCYNNFLVEYLLQVEEENHLRLDNLWHKSVSSAIDSIARIIKNSGSGPGIMCFDADDKDNCDNDIFHVVKELSPSIVIMFGDPHVERPILNNLSMFVPLFVRQYPSEKTRTYLPPNVLSRIRYIPPFAKDLHHFLVHNVNDDGTGKGKESSELSQSFAFFEPPSTSDVMDNFSIYNAIASGYIPVIIGNEKDIVANFMYLNSPPWLFASSLENAQLKICSLPAEEIEAGKQTLQRWWTSCKESYRSLFHQILFSQQK
jgi:hypothetical protein